MRCLLRLVLVLMVFGALRPAVHGQSLDESDRALHQFSVDVYREIGDSDDPRILAVSAEFASDSPTFHTAAKSDAVARERERILESTARSGELAAMRDEIARAVQRVSSTPTAAP